MCMWFGYNTLIIFSHFLCFVNFLHEMLSKCIDSGYLVGTAPLTVFHQLFATLKMFSAWKEDVYVVLV